jgi:hypothetical protein
MGKIRLLIEDDIPAIVALRQKTFGRTYHSVPADLGEYMVKMFLRGPWCDPELPSLVYENAEGRPAGFLGSLPRRMHLQGELLRVAVFTQLMVEPASRGLAGLELVRHFLRGSQDLTLSDAANDAGRGVVEASGGRTSLLYSLYWTRPLRPWRYTASTMTRGRLQKAVHRIAWPLLALADTAAARAIHGATRDAAALPARELTVDDVMTNNAAMSRGHALAACYDKVMLEQVLRDLARKTDEFGRLRGVLVDGGAGMPIGWYLYYEKPGEIGQVVNVAAVNGKYGEILDHMFHDAAGRGLIALRGRLVPKRVAALEEKGCVLGRDGPWMVVHSSKPEVLATIERGDALLTRLDGEFWMTF